LASVAVGANMEQQHVLVTECRYLSQPHRLLTSTLFPPFSIALLLFPVFAALLGQY